MNTNYAQPLQLTASPLAQAIDRWVWAFMAVFFIVITLAGFIPDSLMKIQMVRAGTRAPFPLVLHLHSVLMGAFLVLLLAQSVLMATGRRNGHVLLGTTAFLIVPAIVVVGMILVPTIYQQVWHGAQSAPAPVQEQLRGLLLYLDNIALLQIGIGILFPACMVLALRARRTDPGFHKRMVFLATALPLPAAIDRMTWLPTTHPDSPLSSYLYMFLVVSPLFAWDVMRHRKVHRAYRVWLALFLPFAIATLVLWDTAGWHAFASGLLAP